jgi:hypothetical protein
MKRLAAVVASLLAVALPGHTGAATLRLNMQDRIDSLDSALAFVSTNFDAREDAARALSGADRAAAFASLDDDLMRQAAPIAPFANLNQRDAFSSRIGCQTFNTVFDMDIVDLCLKDPTANGG